MFLAPISLASAISRAANKGYPDQPLSAATLMLAGTKFAQTCEDEVADRKDFLLANETFTPVNGGTATVIM